MSALETKHLLGLRGVSRGDIRQILDTAKQFREILDRPVKKVPSLRGLTIVNLFFENSTRTRTSFELAEKRLSADTVNFASSNSSVQKGETLLDTLRNIEAMKIEIPIIAPERMKVEAITIEKGQTVKTGQVLFTLAPVA